MSEACAAVGFGVLRGATRGALASAVASVSVGLSVVRNPLLRLRPGKTVTVDLPVVAACAAAGAAVGGTVGGVRAWLAYRRGEREFAEFLGMEALP